MLIKKFGQVFTAKYWKNEKLNPEMIAIDTETTLITDPAIVPDVVLTTVYDGSSTVYVVKNKDINNFFEVNMDAKLCFWNAAFDMPVLEKMGAPLIPYLESGRMLDGQVLYRLLSIAVRGQGANRWSLDYVTETVLKEVLEKDDTIRLTFGQYLNDGEVDYSKISQRHLEYACLDPISTFLVTKKILHQIKGLPTQTNLAHDINLYGDIALSRVTRNGMYIDQERVEKIRSGLGADKLRNEEILATYGYVKGKKGNTKVLEKYCIDNNFSLPLTPKGKLALGKVHLQEYTSHPFIDAYIKFKGFSKAQDFLNNINTPIVHPRYNSILVTGRSSCSGPNIQQLPRVGGIRECFIPAPGEIFIDCDYAAIELASIASVCRRLFGYSIMADLINNDKDLHRYAASKIYHVSEDEVSKEQRQTAKILNFGLVANMSPETFVGHAAKFGLTLTLEESTKLKDAWSKIFPEMAQYWKRGYGKSTVITDTGFIRADCSYTEFLNCAMQTKVAEGCKMMLYNLTKAGYKVVAFIHDQILISHPVETASDALKDVKRIMEDSMSILIKGVKVSVDAKLKEKFEK